MKEKEKKMGLELTPIAYARNGFSDKFGIPRQSREDSVLTTRIVFEPAYRQAEALRGIEEYDYLWLIWEFSEVTEMREQGEWRPTVRPPRLGGNKRMGVFATRSPFRPNPLGLTSVRLLRVEQTAEEGLVLVVQGADLMDGTPIYDIKPYLSYSDAHPEARSGFGERTKDRQLKVVWESGESTTREANEKHDVPIKLQQELEEILAQDPRPAYQNDKERVYGLAYAGVEVRFRVDEDTLYVISVEEKSEI